MDNAIQKIAEANALTVFSDPKGLDPCLEQIKKAVEEFKPDLSTATSRKEIASLANKVAKTKVFLDNCGKELVAEWKEKAKKVDVSRKKARDTLDELKIAARKPLTDWEEEEAKRIEIEAENKRKEEQRKQMENDHEMGLLLNEKRELEILKAVEAEKQHQAEILKQQKERDEQIAKEAREKAEKEAKEAEARAKQAEIDKITAQKLAEKQKTEAEAAAKQAELDRIKAAKEAEKQAKIDAEAAAKQATIDAENAQKAREAEAAKELEARENNKKHIGKIRKEAKESLMSHVNEKAAKAIVMAITRGEIANVTINY